MNFDGIIKERPRISDDVCDEHCISKVEFGGHVFCPECAAELTKQHEQDVIDLETEKYYDRNKRFMNRSLYTDKSLKNATFDNFHTTDNETTVNKQKARLLAGHYLKGSIKNTIITGNVGTGKSHLAMSMLKAVNEFSDPNMKCLFVSMDELLAKLRFSYNHNDVESEDDLRRLCVDADLLVIDDLGAEVGSIDTDKQASNDNIRLLKGILNGRMDKPTIFTTNLNREQMDDLYDDRIVSRVMKGISNLDNIISFKETTDKRSKIDF